MQWQASKHKQASKQTSKQASKDKQASKQAGKRESEERDDAHAVVRASKDIRGRKEEQERADAWSAVGEHAKPAQAVRAVEREEQRDHAPLWSGCSSRRTT